VRRILLLLTATMLVAVMMAVTAGPGFAKKSDTGGIVSGHAIYECTKKKETVFVSSKDRRAYEKQGYTCEGPFSVR
jgi:4-hydroxy-3-methylbut-2-en-1-yl diphosphate synthase IspG/GcpE